MRVEDLRIGNIITDENGFQMHVVGIGEDWITADFEGNEGDVWEFDFKYSSPKPIELTEEILLKCGFIEDDFNLFGGIYLDLGIKCSDGHVDYFYKKENESVVKLRSIRDIEIKYLHQLQNLFWCLCEKELQINL